MIKKILKFVFGIFSRAEHCITTAALTRSAARNSNRYAKNILKRINVPSLTEKQKCEISEYWKTYGIRIRDFSQFEWLYGITGIEDPRFIPEDIWGTIVLPYYNKIKYVEAFRNKNLFDTFLPDCNFPKTIIKKIDGLYYDKDGNHITKQQAQECIAMHKEVIFKNAVETGQGRNVSKRTISGVDDAAEALSKWEKEKDYLVQEVVKQHPFFAQFNESSVNIIRFNSFYDGDKVFVHTPVLRFGLPGFTTDVARVNGKEVIRMVGVSENGMVRDKIVHFNCDQEKISDVVENPIFTVPVFDKIIQMIDENAKKLPYFKVIGWDITVDEENNPVVIEYNIRMPGSVCSQITNGPMWGEQTDDVLSFLKTEEAQQNFVPPYYRIKKTKK